MKKKSKWPPIFLKSHFSCKPVETRLFWDTSTKIARNTYLSLFIVKGSLATSIFKMAAIFLRWPPIIYKSLYFYYIWLLLGAYLPNSTKKVFWTYIYEILLSTYKIFKMAAKHIFCSFFVLLKYPKTKLFDLYYYFKSHCLCSSKFIVVC